MKNFNNLFRLDGKVALVVGVGGIGECVAEGLRDFGAMVVAGDLNSARAQAVAGNLLKKTETNSKSNTGAPASSGVQIDITDSSSIKSALDSIITQYQRIDIIVNMVGLNIFKQSLDMTVPEYEKTLAINLTGAWDLSKQAAEIMIRQGFGGKIIHAASVTAFFGSPGQGAYAAAKAGLMNMIQTLAMEFIGNGIYVNGISPVMTETPINTGWLSEVPGRREKIAGKLPIHRLGTPEDFVGPVIFLASEASNFVLGQTIKVDGGASIKHPLIGD